MYDGGGKGKGGGKSLSEWTRFCTNNIIFVEGGHTTPQQSCQRKRKKLKNMGRYAHFSSPTFSHRLEVVGM